MIDISKLTDADIGRWVVYDGPSGADMGKIKSWNDTGIFVVYDAASAWDGSWMDYTAQHTRPEDLRFAVSEGKRS